MNNVTTMTTAEIRKKLLGMLAEYGALKAFCNKHDLRYNYAYRVAKGSIVNLSHSKAIEISNALNTSKGLQA